MRVGGIFSGADIGEKYAAGAAAALGKPEQNNM